ncbi:sensor histidine kinase [Streptomyces sp. cmx-18-6]|uniref:sensor histidine kinase n=1 Tax=Streptomyces sp. cmx-18-6 TaxID=2790930 RepID=UPI00397F9DD5
MKGSRDVKGSGGARVRAVVRRAPRALYADLWARPADRVPRMGEADAPAWRPTLVMLMIFAAACFAVPRTNELVPHPAGGIGGWAVAAALAQSAVLVAGMFRPVGAWWAATALSVVTVAVTESTMSPDRLFPWSIMGMVFQGGALFLLALRVTLRRAVGALAITLLAGVALTLHTTQRHNLDLDRSAPVFVIALVLGVALRSVRLARKDLVVQVELTADERARRTLLEERHRIARELHDVVAHHMSVISIQAQVAPHLVEDPSDELKENLAGIRENALEALTELRRVLGVLRSEDAPAQSTRHTPQPTLDRLDGLVATVRLAGLPVTLATTGEPRPLPPGVELSAYRIVQEALSNVMRHAPGASARVEVAHRAAGLTLRVANTRPDRPAAPSPGVRHGLLGMRERTAMLGGDLATGPTPEGGWEVTAILPVGSAGAAPTTDISTAPATTEDAP